MLSKYFFLLLLFLCIKAIILAWAIQTHQIGLGPDEAQYWTWSQDLSFGYYSKPPGIAWQIWLGTQLFGNTELGVRFGSLIVGILIPLAVFWLAQACVLKPETSFWAGLTMAFIPLGILASFLAITDGGMVLFWTLACILWADALTYQKRPNFWLLGFLILCGALFKWTMYYFWMAALISMFFYPFLFGWQVVGGVVISLFGLIPSLIWNQQHNWVTFRHVFSTMQGGPSLQAHGNFWAFLGEQAALLSPLLFILLGISLIGSIVKPVDKPRSITFCGWLFGAILGLFCAFSLFKKMQGNWCDFAYPTGIVFMVWYYQLKRGKRWLQAGLVLSLLLCLAAFSIPYMQSHGIKFFGQEIPYRFNPFRHNVGWHRLSEKLRSLGYDPKKEFLFGDKYQMASLLSFYSEGQKRAYFLNLHGIRQNQFSFWPGMEQEQKGKTGYFVLTENSSNFSLKERENYAHLLKDYFNEVQLIAIEPLFYSYGRPVKVAMIFRCEAYNGKVPPKPEIY